MALKHKAAMVVTRTGDGSPTLYVPELKEHYHSIHGAVQESSFVFIDNALNKIKNQNINLLEIGFGTGLNAMLSCIEAENQKRTVCYHAIEKFPLSRPIWQKLGKFFSKDSRATEIFRLVHECGWEREVQLTNFFTLKKIKSDIITYYSTGIYEVVFFDAFSPDVQPEMWTTEIFSKIAGMMNHGAVLSTYSAKGQVRRNMISAGLDVERLAGPPGKREILVAKKPDRSLY
jgi:tRNA U34 5-methylaminomethyl-2-thiouridine-forming methyltransferase MnmC